MLKKVDQTGLDISKTFDIFSLEDTVTYTKGTVVQDVFTQFPGPNTPVATDGASWRAARKRMHWHQSFTASLRTPVGKVQPLTGMTSAPGLPLRFSVRWHSASTLKLLHQMWLVWIFQMRSATPYGL
ncbi:hypothetical protein Clacol_005073 [Clathrus columnatus]|uniref:Cytochrome P450 n=1 Tax=Clathrus columnatus TaxID=1419009 RepID=A0AAV5A941_9AGAM|nr:hypothetical protein Clacol_005073 [Clathrus columnatus]